MTNNGQSSPVILRKTLGQAPEEHQLHNRNPQRQEAS